MPTSKNINSRNIFKNMLSTIFGYFSAKYRECVYTNNHYLALESNMQLFAWYLRMI